MISSPMKIDAHQDFDFNLPYVTDRACYADSQQARSRFKRLNGKVMLSTLIPTLTSLYPTSLAHTL